ncbi:putative Glycosyl transferase group 1 domain-containing protein [Phytophthora infestans]|uniref:Putative Glycosyl transferase group 1 domain-containing protein n=1 Tax=Phytophthora infestans TaxID=4787 RepID=A0A833TM11_PHYIN|nr:putative Glycosyl transferase group 1 domain-containing protein [Phytophthora infestans]
MQTRRLSSASSSRRGVSACVRSRSSTTRSLYRQIALLVAVLFALLLLEGGWRSGPSYVEELENDHELEFYPLELLQDLDEIDDSERLHLAMLHEGCLKHRESVITSDFGRTGDKDSQVGRFQRDDKNLRQKLEKCPDVEIYLPSSIRGDGYCEDAMGYVKYLQGRALPRWVLDVEFEDKTTGKKLTYHDLCPKTPMIFMNHFWDDVPNSPLWPESKHVYLMPNVEMYELEAAHYWRVDMVLCKTAICARRVRMWYQQEGNPRHTRVIYTRHTTSDAAFFAKSQLSVDANVAKNFSHVHFVHTAGKSVFKGTNAVLDCWLSRPEFPPLDVFVDQEIYNIFMRKLYDDQIKAQPEPKKITLHTGRVPSSMFGRMMIESAFLLCTSVLEGYGHYINQARASAALIVTTDAPPMNELLSPESAILVPHPSTVVEKQLLGGNFDGDHGLHGVKGMATYVKGAEICDAVERVLEMTSDERQAMGKLARKQYVLDTHFFAARMKELRGLARAGDVSWYSR